MNNIEYVLRPCFYVHVTDNLQGSMAEPSVLTKLPSVAQAVVVVDLAVAVVAVVVTAAVEVVVTVAAVVVVTVVAVREVTKVDKVVVTKVAAVVVDTMEAVVEVSDRTYIPKSAFY